LGIIMTAMVTSKGVRRRSTEEILRYSATATSRSTVRRHYALWRQSQGLPSRCDIPTCPFYTEPLVWQNATLPLILDHVNGNNRDNRPNNLRYLCPNCDSQLDTRGGRNRGRVLETRESGYVVISRSGKRQYHFFPEAARFQLTGHALTLLVRPSGSTKSK